MREGDAVRREAYLQCVASQAASLLGATPNGLAHGGLGIRGSHVETDEILTAFGLTDVPQGIDATTEPTDEEIARVREILRAYWY
jgi:hypothetical protein